MILRVEFQFNAAHRLPHYQGPCFHTHGHNYKLQVVLSGTPNPKDGMIQDFDEIRRQVWETSLVRCDHHNLNDFIDNPTGENLIVWIWEQLKPRMSALKELRLWETPEYCVTYRED